MDVIKDRICVKYGTENIETKGETAGYQQFLLLFQCFPKPVLLGTSKPGLVWERVKDESYFDKAGIHVEPPPVDELTDEESGSEDEEDGSNKLSGHQLNQEATSNAGVDLDQEQNPVHDDETSNSEELKPPDNCSDTDDYELPSTSTAGERPAKRIAQSDPGPPPKRPPNVTRRWLNTDLPESDKNRFIWREQNIDISRLPQTPDGIFNLFFDDEVIEMIVKHTITYAVSKGKDSFTTSADEIRAFIAILLISGYNNIPNRRLYWSKDVDLRNEAIANAMTRDRFELLVKYVHVCDNSRLDKNDKFSKVRPLLDLLNERFLLYFFEDQNLSFGESMIPCYGRNEAKQSIRGRPIRFGYKLWALTTAQGYVLQLEPDQGTNAKDHQTHDPDFPGKDGAVVMNFLSKLQADRAYHLTFVNGFNSLKLVDRLTEMGVSCTGTIHDNHIQNEDCPVKSVKEMEKERRGSYDKRYDAVKGMIVARWNDNNIVDVVSNCHGVEPIHLTARWTKSGRGKIRIEQPFLIHHYKQTAGGVDKMDQNVDKYRISIGSKKWWWSVFTYCIDLAVQQTWYIYRATEAGKSEPLDLLGVRRAIVNVLLAQGRATIVSTISPPRPGGGRLKQLSKRIPDHIRLDGNNHYAGPSKQRRCAWCKGKCGTVCLKCNVGVHRKCFQAFHSF